MTQVSIHEAKTHLSRLIEKVMRGEEVIISKRNRPVVRLVLEKPQVSTKAFGALRDYIGKLPEGWDEPFKESDLQGGALDEWLEERAKPKPKRKSPKAKARKAA